MHEKARLLRGPGRVEGRAGGRNQEVLPPPGPQAPPRRQPGRQVRPEEVPGGPGGLRRPEGREKRGAYDRFGHAGPGAGLRRPEPSRGAPDAAAPGVRPGGQPLRDLPLRRGGSLRPVRQPLRRGARGGLRPRRARTLRGHDRDPVPRRGARRHRLPFPAAREDLRDVRRHRPCRQGTAARRATAAGASSSRRRVRIKIPEGPRTAARSASPEGRTGIRGRHRGDLYVTVRVLPHRYFERQGNDIHGVVPVTVKEAYAGAEIDVPTIHGTAPGEDPAGNAGPAEISPPRAGDQEPAHRTAGRSHLHRSSRGAAVA